jgi:hypothetical protein
MTSRETRSKSKLRNIPEDEEDKKTEVIPEEIPTQPEETFEPPAKVPRGSQSQVARNFQNLKLPTGELAPGMVPGVGEVVISKLALNQIRTVNQLIAVFFTLDRDEGEFIEHLEAMGIRNQDARVIAYNFALKFGPL